MQIGHIYGEGNSILGRSARVSSVYVQGKLTAAEDMAYMKDLAQFDMDNGGDGIVQYTGNATYMENLHFNDPNPRPGVNVNGVSNFDVDFVNDSLTGNLAFADINKNIDISADISGNTFAGTDGNVQTSGGFYGEDAKFLGGIYQEALEPGGSGTEAGTGTTFQGTFGAEKQ